MTKAQIKALFHQRVLGAYERYRDLRQTPRTGMNRLKTAALDLATAIHHFPELLPKELGWSPLERSDEVVFVMELSNASKHGVRKQGQQTYLDRFDAISEIAISTQYEDEIGRYTDTEVRIIVACLDGADRDVDPFLVSAINQWTAYLSAFDVTPALELASPPLPGSTYVSRANSRQLDLEANRQTDFNPAFQLRRFDPVTSTSYPIDPADAQLAFRVYQPPTPELVFSLILENTGQEVQAILPLTTKEVADLDAAAQLGLRDAMLAKIAELRRGEIESIVNQKLTKLDVNATRT